MGSNGPDRILIIGSRLVENYQLTASGLKNLQHIFTTWFPRMVYFDLTHDTVRLNVTVRRGMISGKNVFSTSFLRADGSVIKSAEYDEDLMIGKVCAHYDQSKSRYLGKEDGFDCRVAYYKAVL